MKRTLNQNQVLKPRANALNMFTEQALNTVGCLLGDVCPAGVYKRSNYPLNIL